MGGSFRITPCISIGWALSQGDVTAFACESDWTGALLQTMGTLLTGLPAAFLDFVNWTHDSDILQLGYCGVGIPCIIEPTDLDLLEEAKEEGEPPKKLKEKVLKGEISVTDALLEHGVNREAGIDIGPTLIGQFQYGMKNGIDMIKTPDGMTKDACIYRGKQS